jgi:hypothetical protein
MGHRLVRYLLFIFELILVVSLYACAGESGPPLQWSQTYTGRSLGDSTAVQQTEDGGYVVCGSMPGTYGIGDSDVWLMKTDAGGNKLWEQSFGGQDPDVGDSVQQTMDSGYIVCGYTWSYGAGEQDIWLIKTDSDGNKLWDKTFGGEAKDWGYPISVQQTTDGGYVVCGSTEREKYSDSDVWLIKTDADGNKLWDKTFDGHFSGMNISAQQTIDMASSVQQTRDDGFIICGNMHILADGGANVWLIKTDPNGNKLWDNTFSEENVGYPASDYGRAVQQTVDGGYIICGSKYSCKEDNYSIWLIKTDADGNKLWDKIFSEKICIARKSSDGYAVQQTTDGGYMICGTIYSYLLPKHSLGYRRDIWLIKTDADGNKLWDERLGGNGYADGKTVQQTADAGYIVGGHVSSRNDDIKWGALLLKIAPDQ